MKQFENIIAGLNPIQLEEAEKVKLFDRTDSKYIFKLNQLETILEKLNDEYRYLK